MGRHQVWKDGKLILDEEVEDEPMPELVEEKVARLEKEIEKIKSQLDGKVK